MLLHLRDELAIDPPSGIISTASPKKGIPGTCTADGRTPSDRRATSASETSFAMQGNSQTGAVDEKLSHVAHAAEMSSSFEASTGSQKSVGWEMGQARGDHIEPL